jgi:drug/metabolite transporter (DMT)-like permease
MLALGYPIVVFGSLIFLGEPVGLQRVLGSLLILAGVYVMYHSWGR